MTKSRLISVLLIASLFAYLLAALVAWFRRDERRRRPRL